MRKIKFIINPAAGDGSSKNTIKLIHDKMENAKMEYSISISGYKGDVEILAKEAVQENYTDIVAVGGDGTVLEVFNEIIHHDINLGIIPAGTGNDLIKMIGLTKNYEDCIDRIIKGKTRKIDIGVVNDMFFLNVVGMGIDSEIVEMTEKAKKFLKGTAAYVYSTFRMLATYKCKKITINIDGMVIERLAYLVAVGNGKYYGGGMMITPKAEIDNEQFQVTVIKKMSKLKFTILFSKVFSGAHIHEDPVEVYYGKNIRISSDSSLKINADGNIIGNKKCDIHILPKAQKVII